MFCLVMESNVFVSYYSKCDEGLSVPLETLIVVFVSQWVKPNKEDVSDRIDLPSSSLSENESDNQWDLPSFSFVPIQEPVTNGCAKFIIPISALDGFSVNFESLPEHCELILQCSLPCILTCESKLCIAGLGNILRHLLKKGRHPKCKQLLGFREGCLVACAESSVWTRFCEVDLINSVQQYLLELSLKGTHSIPLDVCRFEIHLNKPVRTHNIGKKQHQMAVEMLRDREERKAKMRLMKLPDLPHIYAEELSMALSDLIIYVCIHLILCRLPATSNYLKSILPAVMRWYSRLCSDPDVKLASLTCGLLSPLYHTLDKPGEDIVLPSVLQDNLHIRDPRQYSSRRRLYTRQTELTAILDILQESQIVPRYNPLPDFPKCKTWSWSEVPDVVLPTFGNLPQSRFVRKCQQLENMAKVVCSIVQDGDVIVDFCSGGGHLGILLAYLLPKCYIIMIENKEESVNRALLRAKHFVNTRIYQCNLDYFCGKFDVGMALHACGVSTDLVIHCCLKAGASFVVCPCCYGGVHNTHLFSYPRSKEFKDSGLTAEEYYFLGHAADQTHENGHKYEQGKYCMGLVDTDRSLIAEAQGYKMKIFTMSPSSCSPKNNMILGIESERTKKLQAFWL